MNTKLKSKPNTNSMALSECAPGTCPAAPPARNLKGIAQCVRNIESGQVDQFHILNKLEAILADAEAELFGPEPTGGGALKSAEEKIEPSGIVGRILEEADDADKYQLALNIKGNEVISQAQRLFVRLGLSGPGDEA